MVASAAGGLTWWDETKQVDEPLNGDTVNVETFKMGITS
jgi:hypothetical protein